MGGEQNTVGQDRTEQDSAGWVLLFKIKAKEYTHMHVKPYIDTIYTVCLKRIVKTNADTLWCKHTQ